MADSTANGMGWRSEWQAMHGLPTLEVYLLGGFRVVYDGQAVSGVAAAREQK